MTLGWKTLFVEVTHVASRFGHPGEIPSSRIVSYTEVIPKRRFEKMATQGRVWNEPLDTPFKLDKE
jgi:hypothetical protein